MLAAARGNPECAAELIAAGADCNARDIVRCPPTLALQRAVVAKAQMIIALYYVALYYVALYYVIFCYAMINFEYVKW